MLELAVLGVHQRPGSGEAAGRADLGVVLEDQEVVARTVGADHARKHLRRLVGGARNLVGAVTTSTYSSKRPFTGPA